MEKKIIFTKMHGAGNDYIYINCFNETIEDPSALAKKLSQRRFNVGADGLILICPTDKVDFEMKMYNADGSEAEICGNGLRCAAKYAAEHILQNTEKSIKAISHGTIYDIELERNKENKVNSVTVNMGTPIFESKKIPTTINEDRVINFNTNFLDKVFNITCVNMRNPHCVIYVDDVKNFEVEKYGKAIENDKRFPERVNIEFVEIISEDIVEQRTWERGSGETWACGSGASAVCAAGIMTGKTKSPLLIHLNGGDLEITWDGKGNLFLKGSAEEVFSGEIYIDNLKPNE